MALLLAGLTKIEASGNLKIPVFLAIIGDASYTIYLTHSNFEGTILKITRATHIQNIIGIELTYFISLFGAIAMGCLIYFIVEKPLLSFLRRHGR